MLYLFPLLPVSNLVQGGLLMVITAVAADCLGLALVNQKFSVRVRLLIFAEVSSMQ